MPVVTVSPGNMLFTGSHVAPAVHHHLVQPRQDLCPQEHSIKIPCGVRPLHRRSLMQVCTSETRAGEVAVRSSDSLLQRGRRNGMLSVRSHLASIAPVDCISMAGPFCNPGSGNVASSHIPWSDAASRSLGHSSAIDLMAKDFRRTV